MIDLYYNVNYGLELDNGSSSTANDEYINRNIKLVLIN